MTDFNKAFELVVGHEGGFTNNQKDRGNWTSGKIGVGQLKGTKYGIAAMTYPHLDIKNITLDQAKAIYKKDFWDKMQGDKLPYEVAYNVFDGAVNSGVTRAIKWLQMAVGTDPDGNLGPKTLSAINSRNPVEVVSRFNGQRLLFLAETNETTWTEFGRGLVKRVARNLLT